MFSCEKTPYLDQTNDDTDRIWSKILNTKETIQNKTKLPLGNLSEAIERVQKRALNIIYPEAESYAHALQLGKLDRLDDRRVHLCYKYMAKMKSPSHPLHHLLPSPLLDAPNYTLRQKTQKYYLFRNMQVCRTKRVEDFFTFKYFKWFNCYYHCYNCKLLYSR